MIDSYIRGLAERLVGVGVRGRSARRVLAEVRDHLSEASSGGEEEEAIRQFGEPDEIARLVAAELATASTRSATYRTFGALAIAGIGYVVALMLVPAAGGWPDIFGGRVDAIGPISGLVMALLPQIAFVAGCLALVRAVRLRRARAVQAAELDLLRRRGAVALAAGAGTLVALAGYAITFEGVLAGWWTWTTVALCAASMLPLAAAARGLLRSAAPVPEPGGRPGDLFDDFEPLFRLAPVRRLELPRHPWRFALLAAVAVWFVGFAAGWYAEGSPGSGLVRASFEALALLVCFAVLGRSLGLRRDPDADELV